MTVIDERVRVPAPDDAALGRLRPRGRGCGPADRLPHPRHRRPTIGHRRRLLARALARSRRAPTRRGDGPGRLAPGHEPSLDPDELLQLRLELARDAARALGTDEVDIVPLNHASPLIRHRAIRDGRRLVERDRKTRVRLEARAIVEYPDTIPLRAELARGQRHRIEEGRFGRR